MPKCKIEGAVPLCNSCVNEYPTCGVIAQPDFCDCATHCDRIVKCDGFNQIPSSAYARTARKVMEIVCPNCTGLGVVRDVLETGCIDSTCERCLGRKYIIVPEPTMLPDSFRETCSSCDGKGYIRTTLNTKTGRVLCNSCLGYGTREIFAATPAQVTPLPAETTSESGPNSAANGASIHTGTLNPMERPLPPYMQGDRNGIRTRILKACDRVLQVERLSAQSGFYEGSDRVEAEEFFQKTHVDACVDLFLLCREYGSIVDAGADVLVARLGKFWNP